MSTEFNPQIRSLKIGVKTLREIQIYPLSIADQTKATTAITKIISDFAGGKLQDMENEKVVAYTIKAIKENLKTIFEFIVEKDEEIKLEELTNQQFSELAFIIFEVNYEASIKNLKDLSEKAKALWTSEGSSPKSSEKQVTD
jgi:hypothetical protein